MNGNEQAGRKHPSPDDYLEQIRKGFSIFPTSGLCHPKREDAEQQININVAAKVDDPLRTRERPLSSFTDVFANFISSIALLISLLTLVGLGYTVFYARQQWQSMQGTLGEARSQTIAAWMTEELARFQAKKSEQFFKTEERAWRDPESLNPRDVPDAGGPFAPASSLERLTLSFKNFGKTPAINVVLKAVNDLLP